MEISPAHRAELAVPKWFRPGGTAESGVLSGRVNLSGALPATS